MPVQETLPRDESGDLDQSLGLHWVEPSHSWADVFANR